MIDAKQKRLQFPFILSLDRCNQTKEKTRKTERATIKERAKFKKKKQNYTETESGKKY